MKKKKKIKKGYFCAWRIHFEWVWDIQLLCGWNLWMYKWLMYIHAVSSNWKAPTLLTTRNRILVFVLLQSLWLFHSTHRENGLKTHWNRKNCSRRVFKRMSLCPFLLLLPSKMAQSIFYHKEKTCDSISPTCTRTLVTLVSYQGCQACWNYLWPSF